MKRIKWIDIAKGFTILLVILQHISTSYMRLNRYSFINDSHVFKIIDTINMPAFFFLSGLFLDHLFKRSFKNVVVERFKRLMIPYFIWGIISVLLFGIYVHHIYFSRILELPIRPIFVLWFIYSLFIIDVFLYLLHKLLHIKALSFLILLGLYIMYIFWSTKVSVSVNSPYKIVQGILEGALFVYLGYLYKKYISLNFMKKFRYYLYASFLSIIILIIFSFVYSPISFYLNQLVGIIFIIYISKLFVYINVFTRLFSCIGLITMQIYVMHKFIVEFIGLIIFKLSSNFLVFSIFDLIITVFVCYIGVVIINKLHMSKWVFGTKK